MITDLNERSREIFKQIVDAYVTSGWPVGSRAVSLRLSESLSAATVRTVMAELEELGLLYAPHPSSGRIPTEKGLRLFVDGILELGNLPDEEREAIDNQCLAAGCSMAEVLSQAGEMLAGLSSCAGIVLAPKTDRPLKHLEFVQLGPCHGLVVLVTEDGLVENRMIDLPLGLPASTLQVASNYLNARIKGRTLSDVQRLVHSEIEEHRSQLDELSARVVETGLATWAGGPSSGQLIVRGSAKLLEDVTAVSDLEKIRTLFELLETREAITRLLEATTQATGMQIFIGSANMLFQYTGCSVIASSYTNAGGQLIGAIGVIGPTRINYGRIIPMVNYTAKVIGRIIGEASLSSKKV